MMIVLGRLCGDALFFAEGAAGRLTSLVGGGSAARPTGGQKRTAPAVHEQIPFPTCQIRYAEREPATGRAVLLDDTAAQSNRPELSPGTAGPHVFYSTADKHNVRQFVTGHCPKNKNAGPAPRPDHTCLTRLPTSTTYDSLSAATRRRK